MERILNISLTYIIYILLFCVILYGLYKITRIIIKEYKLYRIAKPYMVLVPYDVRLRELDKKIKVLDEKISPFNSKIKTYRFQTVSTLSFEERQIHKKYCNDSQSLWRERNKLLINRAYVVNNLSGGTYNVCYICNKKLPY